MKYLKFLFTGVLFGIVLAKSEVFSWYRIYEMFRFQSFHMYGVMGSAMLLSMLMIWWLKKRKQKTVYGTEISFNEYKKGIIPYLMGGIIYGLGWGLSGACPGPIYVMIGYGYFAIIIVLFGALLGTLLYGILRSKLPH